MLTLSAHPKTLENFGVPYCWLGFGWVLNGNGGDRPLTASTCIQHDIS